MHCKYLFLISICLLFNEMFSKQGQCTKDLFSENISLIIFLTPLANCFSLHVSLSLPASDDDEARILVVGIRGLSPDSSHADLLSGRKDGGQERQRDVKTDIETRAQELLGAEVLQYCITLREGTSYDFWGGIYGTCLFSVSIINFIPLNLAFLSSLATILTMDPT